MKTIAFITVLLASTVALAQQPAPTSNVENGKKQFLRAGCWECHGTVGQGGRDGARLADTALSTAQLTRYVRRPTGAMPAYIDKVMTDSELADIWAYLKSIPAPKPAKDIPLLNALKGQENTVLVLLLIALLHHSFGAEYDGNKPVTLTGMVTNIEWTNPHSHFYLDVKDETGKVVNWKLEGYPPGVLYRTGWKRNETMKVGDTVTVFAWRARDGGPWAHSREITLRDGRKLFFGPPAGTGDGGNAPVVEVK